MNGIFKFNTKDDCIDFLTDMFKNEKNRNIENIKLVAATYGSHDEEIYRFFIEEAKKLLKKYDN